LLDNADNGRVIRPAIQATTRSGAVPPSLAAPARPARFTGLGYAKRCKKIYRLNANHRIASGKRKDEEYVMKTKLLFAALTAVAISACVPSLVIKDDVNSFSRNSKNYDVKVAIIGTDTAKIITPAQGWESSGNKKDGFVGFAPNTFGTTKFGVVGERVSGSCEGTGSNNARWVITKLEVSATGDLETEKGTDFGASQDPWLREAFPNVDLSNGVLFEAATLAQGVTVLSIFNANGHVGMQRFIYYRLTLTRCEDEFETTTDPGWNNGGRD
jgi:hypothetical protein